MLVNIDLTTNAGIHELCYLVAQEIYDTLRCEFLDFSNSRHSTIKYLTWTMINSFPEYYKIVMDNLSTLSFYLGSFTKSLDIWVILSDGSFISDFTIWIELVSWTTHRKHISMANGMNGDFTAQWRELQYWSNYTGESDMDVFNRFVYSYKTPTKEPEVLDDANEVIVSQSVDKQDKMDHDFAVQLQGQLAIEQLVNERKTQESIDHLIAASVAVNTAC